VREGGKEENPSSQRGGKRYNIKREKENQSEEGGYCKRKKEIKRVWQR